MSFKHEPLKKKNVQLFIKTPRAVLCDFELKGNEFQTLCKIWSYDFEDKGYSFPKMKTLEIGLSRDRTNISKSISKLKRLGYLIVKKNEYSLNIYYFTFPLFDDISDFVKRFNPVQNNLKLEDALIVEMDDKMTKKYKKLFLMVDKIRKEEGMKILEDKIKDFDMPEYAKYNALMNAKLMQYYEDMTDEEFEFLDQNPAIN